MAHNPTGTRKTKTTRSKTHQATDFEPPKEKKPRVTITREGQRRGKTTSQQVLETPTKVSANDLHRFGVCQMVSASKSQPRAGGEGAGAPGGHKRHREPSLTPPSAKTNRSSVTTASAQKLTPKELKDYEAFKKFKELKESKPHKEPKEPQAKVAEKSPNASHRHSRHQAERTKNYFDKYLKFAFDLSTPEGVKQLEAHFFPQQDASGAGTSTNRQD